MIPKNPFKGRQNPGQVILWAVRWYLRYPLAYLHVSEILSERYRLMPAAFGVGSRPMPRSWTSVAARI